jgi:hypothetical protein
MKTLLSTLILLCALAAQAATSSTLVTNLYSLAYNNGTNGAGVYYASNVIVPLQKFTIQSLGITNAAWSGSYTTNGITNLLKVNIQYSVDPANSNWVTLATWAPGTTNATVELFSTNIGYINIPMRAQIVTTNSIGVSIFTQP